MTTNYTIDARCFPVKIKDQRTGEISEDMFVADKEQLKTLYALGLEHEEVIYRHYNTLGYRVLEIRKARRQSITINLKELYDAHCLLELGKREKVGV